MEDFFQILIYLFIIFAFLSSLFKKKQKPQAPPHQSPHGESAAGTTTVRTSTDEEYDVLKEIESFFKIPGEETVQQKTETASDYFKSSDWHPEIQQEQKQTVIQSKQKPETWEEKWKRAESDKKKVDDKILRQAELFEKRITTQHSYAIDVKRIISNKFKDPASLKEYIVISEILGKPKAYAKESFGQE